MYCGGRLSWTEGIGDVLRRYVIVFGGLGCLEMFGTRPSPCIRSAEKAVGDVESTDGVEFESGFDSLHNRGVSNFLFELVSGGR